MKKLFALLIAAALSSSAITLPAHAATYASFQHLKKDGTPDRRYNDNKHVKKDGTTDMRFRSSKKAAAAAKKKKS
ncbi:hypothetical protein IDJ77_06650 [Mucilaginibacter sp. ZT4R22]|uniref:Uncharacterized protein n=1 Tax=Mucilaginibacter pankratovii TaxID=2772110 RepID=A0ABR7WMU7_9SPHI|nr:hypothetical protein [Mucilaginibacter pankratovii]MBD1363483.1 hypothetical protein [Mucilaginibacter pankratovii]